MASSSRRGARRDAAASSASPRAAPAAGADLEALVRELLELERFTERRERMLSRTQTRQRERHERERREARERLERLERRERRRRETRARRVETTGSRDAREDDRETRVETSSRRSRSATLDAESDRLDHRGRRDRHEREGARDEPAARRVSGASESARATESSASSASRSATGASASSSASDHDRAFARDDALATEIARLRRRVSRLARAESVTPREHGRGAYDDARARTSRSAPRPRRDASVSAFGLGGSTNAERFFDASFSSSRRALDRRRRASAEGVFARHEPSFRRLGSGVPPFRDEEDGLAFGYDEEARFGEDARGSPTPSLRPDSAIDWETEREHLREFRVPVSEFRVPRHARAGFGDGATPRFSTLGRFFDELRDLRRHGADGDEWFAANAARARRDAERPRGPWRDPRFASPLRSRQRSRDAGADGAQRNAARADDTADERGASPPESGAASPGGAGDDRRMAEPEASPAGDDARARDAAFLSVRAAPSSGDARVGDADAELSLLLSERPGFSEMLAGVLASMRSLPAADLREACVGVITGTSPRARAPAAAARAASGRGSPRPGAAVGSLLGGDTSAHEETSTSDSDFAYAAYASLEPPEAFPRGGTAPAPVGAPWDGSDVPEASADAGGAAGVVRGALVARHDARTPHLAVSRSRAAGPESDEGGEIVTFSDLFGGVARAATSAPRTTPAASADAAADPLATAPPPSAASVPTAADAAALVARHASAADTQAERAERASSPPPPPPPLAAGPGVGSPRAIAAAEDAAASAAADSRGFFPAPADAADAFPSGALSVDGEAMSFMLEREERAQRDAEMSPFAEGAHDDGADLVDFAGDAASRATAAASAALDADAAASAALAPEDRFDPPSAPETLDQAASRLPFSESLNATLLEALGSVVAEAGGAAAEAAAAADAEALEARAKADARAAAAAAEIAAARAHSSESVSARVGRQNGEALASRAEEDAGSSPASASTAPDAPPSPGAKRRFKERLKMFNTPAS